MANKAVLALDVGEKRVGVAIVRAGLSVAQPLTTLERGEQFWQDLTLLIQSEKPGKLVIGLPRGLDGQETAQTAAVRRFRDELVSYTALPLIWQDEALTSVKAEETLRARGGPFAKSEVDAVAASYILADYIEEQKAIS